MSRPRLGVSACLVGARVRFDGGHKHDMFVSDALTRFAELLPVCPEMELGLGAPRESLRLLRRGGEVALVASRSGRDFTLEMRDYAARKADQVAGWDLDGYIVKKDSPSCGRERVRIYDERGSAARTGRGLFTAALMTRLPLLPVEEEGRLRDPALRDAFLARVFVHPMLKELFAGDWRPRDVIALHARLKLLLLAHSPVEYRALGRLVARAGELERAELAAEYPRRVLAALTPTASVGRHVTVLQHMAGYFKRRLPGVERAELAALIDDYRAGRAPRAAPLALIGHHARRHGVEYLCAQLYLAPYPKELGSAS